MKTYSKIVLAFFAIAFLLTSCNFFRKGGTNTPVKFITHKEGMDTILMAVSDSLIVDSLSELPVEYGLLKNESAMTLLNKVNLPKLISSKFEENEYPHIYNGFIGDDHYRIEFYVSHVDLNIMSPFSLLVKGKTRYKETVTPFLGRINLDSTFSVLDQSYEYKSFLKYADSTERSTRDTTDSFYHLKGTFQFAEDRAIEGSGVYTGNFYMDISKYMNGDEEGFGLHYYTENETRKAGLLMEGTKVAYADNAVKPVIAAHDLFMFANDILEDFSYGEREIEINQKYRSLGWDNFWENNEWWAESNEKVVMNIFTP